jgi:hypothetical protein
MRRRRRPLGVHFHAAVTGERLPKEPPMLSEHLRKGLGTERVEQPGRALRVGEEEGYGAGRKPMTHGQ